MVADVKFSIRKASTGVKINSTKLTLRSTPEVVKPSQFAKVQNACFQQLASESSSVPVVSPMKSET